MLEAIIANVNVFLKASSDRITLYKVFVKLFTLIAIRVPMMRLPTTHKKSTDDYYRR